MFNLFDEKKNKGLFCEQVAVLVSNSAT